MRRNVDQEKPEQKNVPAVQIGILSARYNSWLTNYFTSTLSRERLFFLLESLVRHQSLRTANAMAFDLFLALMPMLGLAGWAASLVLLSGASEGAAGAFLAQFTPAQLAPFIGEYFEALAAAPLAPLAAIGGWWLASSSFNTMLGVFEETFACQPRSWVKRRAIALLFALGGMFVLGFGSAIGVALVIDMPPALVHIMGRGSTRFLVNILVGGLSLTIATACLALLYRYSIRRPSRKRRSWPGAMTAAGLGVTASIALGYYAGNIARYAFFYGGLAAIVIVMLWLWLWSTAILLGAEINIALEDVAFEKKNAAPEASQ